LGDANENDCDNAPPAIFARVNQTGRILRYLPESIKLAESYGYDVIAAPMIELREKDDPEFDVFVQRVLNHEVDYVIFTSANGVAFALKRAGNKKFVDALNTCNIVAIGPNTQRELEKHSIHVDLMPATYSSDGIVSALTPLISEKKAERLSGLRWTIRSMCSYLRVR